MKTRLAELNYKIIFINLVAGYERIVIVPRAPSGEIEVPILGFMLKLIEHVHIITVQKVINVGNRDKSILFNKRYNGMFTKSVASSENITACLESRQMFYVVKIFYFYYKIVRFQKFECHNKMLQVCVK